MNSIESPTRRRWRAILLFCLPIVLLVSACGSKPAATPTLAPPTATAAQPTATPAPPTATQVPPTATPSTTEPSPDSVKAIAESIAAGVGKVGTVVDGKSGGSIFVFEETHVSPAGQIEIAIMLNRLYENHGLRHVGLEGAFAKDGQLDATKYHYPPPFRAHDPVRPPQDIVVSWLEGGDIGSAEMMALIYEDLEVVGIEDENEYNPELSEAANAAPVIYLYQIAILGLTQDQIVEANRLISEGREDEAITYIINATEFTKQAYAELNDPKTALAVEGMVDLIDRIAKKATEVGVEISSQDQQNFQEARAFFEARSMASGTMVGKVLQLVKQFPNAPVAMTMGAAHTEKLVGLLRQAGVPFAVISPNSLISGSQNGDLSNEAFDRKGDQLSVDPPGSLGVLLDGRKKPRPVLPTVWAKSDSELRLLTTLIARAAAQGQTPPFEAALSEVLPMLTNVTIVPDSFQIMDGDVVFAVMALKEAEPPSDPPAPVQIWVRARADQIPPKVKFLEERLFEGLDRVRAKDKPDGPEPPESKPILMRISSDTMAKFSTDAAAIKGTTLSG
jgi:hypothetical protein